MTKQGSADMTVRMFQSVVMIGFLLGALIPLCRRMREKLRSDANGMGYYPQ
jgi:hypothetical protein